MDPMPCSDSLFFQEGEDSDEENNNGQHNYSQPHARMVSLVVPHGRFHISLIGYGLLGMSS